MSGAYQQIRKLDARDGVESFDCGKPSLNAFLTKYALVNQRANSAQTYVCCQGTDVVGYHSLCVGSVDPAQAPTKVTKGLARHSVPVMLLARLAVDQAHQRVGLGTALLLDALRRTANAADIVGIRALLVHAQDEDARRWYLRWEFEPSPTDPLHLFLLTKDLLRNLGR